MGAAGFVRSGGGRKASHLQGTDRVIVRCKYCHGLLRHKDWCYVPSRNFRNHLKREDKMKTPPELDRIADRVLAYRPKPKTKAAKRRKRRDQYAKRRRSESSI